MDLRCYYCFFFLLFANRIIIHFHFFLFYCHLPPSRATHEFVRRTIRVRINPRLVTRTTVRVPFASDVIATSSSSSSPSRTQYTRNRVHVKYFRTRCRVRRARLPSCALVSVYMCDVLSRVP